MRSLEVEDQSRAIIAARKRKGVLEHRCVQTRFLIAQIAAFENEAEIHAAFERLNDSSAH